MRAEPIKKKKILYCFDQSDKHKNLKILYEYMKLTDNVFCMPMHKGAFR